MGTLLFDIIESRAFGLDAQHATHPTSRPWGPYVQGTSKIGAGVVEVQHRGAAAPPRLDHDEGVRVLLVEDDAAIAASVVDGLTSVGFDVAHVVRGRDAIADLGGADLVLLDLGLPDIDGHDVCRSIRAASNVPIIVLTARDTEIDRVLGLELGADDFVGKPFSMRELVARIRAVTRRSRSAGGSATGDAGAASPDSDVTHVGPLSIDRRTRRVTLRDEEIAFTQKEFDVLAYLADDPGAVRSRTDIIEHVWDSNWFGPTKTLDAHVAAVRKKLGDNRWIEAVRGVGFRLEEPE
jgi:DNA-binding response OmpR family regulator